MNVKTMEGLAGASTSIGMIATPMSVAEEAERKGDTDKMQRALGYAAGLINQADEYGGKTSEGMKLDAKEAKKQEKLRQEKLVEARKEEREEQEERIEEGRQEGARTDSVEISEEGKELAAAGVTQPATQADPDCGSSAPDITYDSSGMPVEAVQAAGETIDMKV